MKKYSIEMSDEARQDMKDIAVYIKYNLQEPNISKRIINKLKKSKFSLINNPYLYSIIDDDYLKKQEMRKIVVGNYIVFYRIFDNTFKIEIARIMYGRRNWQEILK